MADVLVYIISARESLECDNCGTTQLHELKLYWNDTVKKLEMQRHCVCQDTEEPTQKYQENRDVLLTDK